MWINPGWSRTGDSPLPPLVPPCPREAPPLPAYAPCDQDVARWERETTFKFPPYHYLWKNGLTHAKTWRWPDADEKERLLAWELEKARLRILGTAVHTGVLLAYLFSVFLHRHLVPTVHQPVVTLVDRFSLGSDEIIANPGADIIREVLRRQKHTGREVRRLGPMEHPSALPRRTLRPSWW